MKLQTAITALALSGLVATVAIAEDAKDLDGRIVHQPCKWVIEVETVGEKIVSRETKCVPTGEPSLVKAFRSKEAEAARKALLENELRILNRRF